MIGNKKEINAGDDSTNIQAQNVTIQQNGLSYSVVKEVAMDVFKSNFYDLGEKVEKLVNDRAEEVLNKYLKKLEEESPEAVGNTVDPDVRYAIYEVQKNHARRGDQDIAELLVGVLIERTKNQEESFKKIVLNEALTIIPKLTTKQIDVLSIIYLFRYLNFKPEFNVGFNQYYNFLYPLIMDTNIPTSEMFFQHLQYSGCLSISVASLDFKGVMTHKFPNMGDEELNVIVSSHPELDTFRANWNNSKLCHASLTSVGIAIAVSNVNRRLGVEWDLSIWINE